MFSGVSGEFSVLCICISLDIENTMGYKIFLGQHKGCKCKVSDDTVLVTLSKHDIFDLKPWRFQPSHSDHSPSCSFTSSSKYVHGLSCKDVSIMAIVATKCVVKVHRYKADLWAAPVWIQGPVVHQAEIDAESSLRRRHAAAANGRLHRLIWTMYGANDLFQCRIICLEYMHIIPNNIAANHSGQQMGKWIGKWGAGA